MPVLPELLKVKLRELANSRYSQSVGHLARVAKNKLEYGSHYYLESRLGLLL